MNVCIDPREMELSTLRSFELASRLLYAKG